MVDENVFGFETFPRLMTGRLTLREITADDAQSIFRFRSDPEVQRFNGPTLNRVEDCYSLILSLQKEIRRQTGIVWGVTLSADDEVIGLMSLHNWSQYHRRAEVGYDLNRDYWGQGIASEALQAVIHFGFTELNLNHIHASTIATNTPSVRLLEKVGFQLEGTRRSYSLEDDGAFHDGAMFSILQSEYELAQHNKKQLDDLLQ